MTPGTPEAHAVVLAGGGEMAERVRGFDWSRTPLGPADGWSPGLRMMVRRVFANLLNNAAKYTDRGGRIRLAVERQGAEAVVRVEDNGVGIPPPMLDKVFEMLSQVDRSLEKSQGRLGIGLNIVRRRIAAASGGYGTGSTSTVRLPVASVARPAARRRILVADDNADGAESLTLLLDMLGNETRTAHDGRDAVAATAASRPDVILMDIGMPRLNGYEACRRIREQGWAELTPPTA